MESSIDILKRFWKFIWHDDSLLSWITFIIVVFVLIKFIFFPAVSFVMGTSLPIVIVESCSMYHGTSFDKWWESNSEWYGEKNITKEQFSSFTMRKGFSKGDIFFVRGIEAEKLNIGDIIIFASGTAKRPIIHRIVQLNPIETKGDHNSGQFNLNQPAKENPERIDETHINEEQIIGKVTFIKIPALGWIKLIFFEPFRADNERGFCE